MKKAFLILSVLIYSVTLFAQDLEKIVEKHLDAIGADKLSNHKTLIVEGSMEMMGMSLNLVLLEKAPDKMKTITSFSGTETVVVINGSQGYMINPMMGSTEPVELPIEEINQQRNNSMLRSSLPKNLKEGNLELEGEEDVEGKPAFKIKIQTETGDNFIYIDKKTYFIVKMKMSIMQMGESMDMELLMGDFTDFNGVIMAKKIETYMNGQHAGVVNYTKFEFDVPVADSEFELK